jgi:PTS system nitrogen regulatory IIA component
MKISDCLSLKDVFVDLRAANKRQLLEELCRKIADKVPASSDDILDQILKREQLGSTGMGSGVAIPHARLQAVIKPSGVLARLKQPIDFDAIDGQPVDLVFLLLLPAKKESEQLGALAAIARKMRSNEDLAGLRKAKNATEMHALLTT